MTRFRIHPLESASVVEEGEAAALSPALEARVAAIYRAECERREGPLHDAPIFNVERFSRDEIRGHFVPYRRWIAQLCEPELRHVLDVRPAGVCALCWLGDSLVFGRRSPHATLDGGCWEPVPAGGIGIEARAGGGAIEGARQLTLELHEELGVPAHAIREIRPFALVVDSETGVHDIVFALALALDPSGLEACFATRPTREVTELRIVPAHEIEDFTRAEANALAPISEVLLRAHAGRDGAGSRGRTTRREG